MSRGLLKNYFKLLRRAEKRQTLVTGRELVELIRDAFEILLADDLSMLAQHDVLWVVVYHKLNYIQLLRIS